MVTRRNTNEGSGQGRNQARSRNTQAAPQKRTGSHSLESNNAHSGVKPKRKTVALGSQSGVEVARSRPSRESDSGTVRPATGGVRPRTNGARSKDSAARSGNLNTRSGTSSVRSSTGKARAGADTRRSNPSRSRAASGKMRPASGQIRMGEKPNAPKTSAASPRRSVNLGGGTNSGAAAQASAQRETLTKRLKIAGIAVAALLAVYLLGTLIFTILFCPNPKMGSFDLSLKTTGDVENTINNSLKNYKLNVSGQGFSFSVDASQTGVAADTKSAVEAARANQNAWSWPIALIQGNHDETDKLIVTGDSGTVAQLTQDALKQFNEKQEAPVHANIAYDATKHDFTIVPEEEGTQLDSDKVTEAVGYAVANLDPELSLDESYILRPTVYASDSRVTDAIATANTMLASKTTITLDNYPVATADAGVLQDMIRIDGEAKPILDEAKFDAWIYETLRSLDTVNETRTYTRPDGKVCTVTGGVYGWMTSSDELRNQLTTTAQAGKTGNLEVPCTKRGAVYNGPGQQDWGARYADVDITEQHVRFYDSDGSVIWESDCITGAPDGEHDTVQGVWTINNKLRNNKLIGIKNGEWLYETEVAWWMPFEDDSIGFHDAPWQTRFGPPWYEWGAGSHGCVNLPSDAAESLYGLIEIGDVVVVHQ